MNNRRRRREIYRPGGYKLGPPGGYKLGPSNVPDFLLSSINFPMGYGLMVSISNKLGGATVAYKKES